MSFKDLVQKALRQIIRKQTTMNLSSRFIFIKIQKVINETVNIASVDDLKCLKYIKEKSLSAIVEEINKIMKEDTKSVNKQSKVTDCDVSKTLINTKNLRCVQNTTNLVVETASEHTMKNQNVESIYNVQKLDNEMKFLEIESSSDSYCRILQQKYQVVKDRKQNLEENVAFSFLSNLSTDLSDLNLPILTNTQNTIDNIQKSINLENKIKNDESGLFESTDNVYNKTNKSDDEDGCVVLNATNKSISEMHDRLISSFSDLTLDNIVTKTHNKDLDSMMTTSLMNSTITNKTRKYIPGYRTAAYAILKALYHHNGAHKHLVVLRATPYTDTEFDKSKRFSAFSAFKTLLNKGLIVCNSECKYFLTDCGMELGKKLFNNETVESIENNNNVQIIVDSREKKSSTDRNYFQTYFTNKGIDCQTRYLSLGDFIWIFNERLLPYIVERKQSTDLVSSVSDGRYKEQKQRLVNLGFNAFYLVENLKVDESRRKFINRCLLEVRLQGFILLETANIQESASVLEKLDQMIRKDRKDRTETAETVGLGYGSFLEESNKNKITVNDMLLFALLSIKGLGKELAKGLSQKYKTLQNFSKASTGDKFEKELAEFSYENKKVGHKIAARIIKLVK